MRKYKQLLLVLVSVISITILLFYRSENSRLKYILQVVNFFGRNDAAALVKVENTAKLLYPEHDYSAPLPVWQRLGNDFHGYSSFWIKNDLVAGGEVIVVAVGILNVTPKFKCSLNFKNKKNVTGKFGFSHITQKSSPFADSANALIAFQFVCKITLDFGTPDQIILKNTETNERFLLYIRNTNDKKTIKQLLTSCVDLNEYNITHGNNFHLNKNLMDFFIIHHLQGIEEFLVYSTHVLNLKSKISLLNNGVRINILPYNFPFSLETHYDMVQELIKTDCHLRNYNSAKYFIIQSPNELVYINNVLNDNNKSKFLSTLNNGTYKGIDKFQVKQFNVCYDHNKEIFDNFSYNTDLKYSKFYIFNANGKFRSENLQGMDIKSDYIIMTRYVECNGKFSKADYRNVINHHFINLMNSIHSNTKKLVI